MGRNSILFGVLAVFAASLMIMGDGTAQITKGKKRPAATKFLMLGINQPNCAGLAKLLKDGPANDKEWVVATCHACCLNEMGYVLMDDGRCPDAAWAGAAKSLREGGLAVAAAAAKKDLEAARAAFKTVTQACAACHKAHRSD